MADSEKPFQIAVSDEDLGLLHKKLELTRFPDELENASWDYGVPLADVQRLINRWKDGYDWRAAEAELNAELPMFTREIEVDGQGTLTVQYIHKKSEVENAIPLLFVHGWPGSFIEVRKVLPLLVAPSDKDAPSFHVIALGLPGYAFSEQPHKRGFGPFQYAETGHKLMLALGYNEYVVQGGDWGYAIGRIIAAKYGVKHVKAWHTNMAVTHAHPRFSTNPLRYLQTLITPQTALERAGINRGAEFFEFGRAYHLEQATKPQTLAYALADSPAGTLAWIYEKLVAWSDDYPWNDDEVLTWISLYWFSRAGPAASTRIYYEDRLQMKEQLKLKIKVPIGISSFPKEIFRMPNAWLRILGNIVQLTEHGKGGHFAAHEVPGVLVADLWKMFGKGGPAYGVVPGKAGYQLLK